MHHTVNLCYYHYFVSLFGTTYVGVLKKGREYQLLIVLYKHAQGFLHG